MSTLQDVLSQLGDAFTGSPTTPIDGNTLSQPSTLSFIGEDVAAAVAAAKPVAPTVAAPGAPFSAMYVFGDSLSDTGNVSLATLGTVPVSPPYADRSFSNGPVWAQDVAQSIGLPALMPSLAGGTDFAYGGAETGQTQVHTLNPTDLPSQFAQFQAQVTSPQPGALYAVWIGSNDVLDIADNTSLTSDQQQANVAAAVNNEVSVIDGLVAHGAQNLLVLNVPDLGNTPHEQASGSAAAQSAQSLAALYNTDLANALQPLEASGQVKIDLVDTFSALNQVVTNPAEFGFTNVTSPVWTGNLTDSNSGMLQATGVAQNQFLSFDSLHPTAQAHALLASGIEQNLTATA
jgi:phospholipase/lecithinase/hemolysin